MYLVAPKPHIWKKGHRWMCGAQWLVWDALVVNDGDTPLDAYNNYQTALVLIFERCRPVKLNA